MLNYLLLNFVTIDARNRILKAISVDFTCFTVLMANIYGFNLGFLCVISFMCVGRKLAVRC